MSLINKQEENSPEFEVIKGGRTISPMNFSEGMDDEAEIDLVEIGWTLLDKLHYIVLSFLIGAVLFNEFLIFVSSLHISLQGRCMLYLRLRIRW